MHQAVSGVRDRLGIRSPKSNRILGVGIFAQLECHSPGTTIVQNTPKDRQGGNRLPASDATVALSDVAVRPSYLARLLLKRECV